MTEYEACQAAFAYRKLSVVLEIAKAAGSSAYAMILSELGVSAREHAQPVIDNPRHDFLEREAAKVPPDQRERIERSLSEELNRA